MHREIINISETSKWSTCWPMSTSMDQLVHPNFAAHDDIPFTSKLSCLLI